MQDIPSRELIWALGSCCALHGKPFDPQLLLKQHAPPYSSATLITAARALGFQARLLGVAASELVGISTTAILLLEPVEGEPGLGLLVRADANTITWIVGGSNDPTSQPLAEFEARYSGQVFKINMGNAIPKLRGMLTLTGAPNYPQLNAYMLNSALDRQAIAPLWEVKTARMQETAGDPNAGVTEEERAAKAGLSAVADVAYLQSHPNDVNAGNKRIGRRSAGGINGRTPVTTAGARRYESNSCLRTTNKGYRHIGRIDLLVEPANSACWRMEA